jgi:hypothetical protein
MEMAFAIERILDGFMGKGMGKTEAIGKVLKLFGKRHTVWVYHHLGLLRLCPAVADLMKKRKISFQVGVALTNFKPEAQVRFARDVIGKNLDHKAALRYIRSQRKPEFLASSARHRRPSADYQLLRSFLRRLGDDADAVLDMDAERFKGMFRKRSSADLAETIGLLEQCATGLAQLKETLEEVKNERSPKAASARS